MSMNIRVETYLTRPSAGHIYFQTPIQEEIDKAYEWIATECRRRLQEVYGQWDTAAQRLETALAYLKESNTAFYLRVSAEIAMLSKDTGSPILLSGVGSVLDYLLDISPIDPLPAHYTCPACHYTEEAFNTADGFDLAEKICPVCGQPMLHDGHNCPESLSWFSCHGHGPYRCSELQITKQVLEEAQRRLQRLSSCQSLSDTYCAIAITARGLSLLQALSEATPIPLREIPLNDRRLWEVALNRILDIHFPDDSIADIQYDPSRITDFGTLIRLIGLRQGAFSVDRDFCKLTEAGYFLLRDELEQALVRRNVPKPTAAKLAYACRRADRESVPPDLRPIVEKTEYLWPKTSCINIFLREYWEQWYQMHHPKEYEALSKEFADV